MFKRVVIFFVLNVICIGFVFGQSSMITRLAVVDLPRVYTTFFQESRAVREFMTRSTNVQNEIDRMQREIQNLRSTQAEAISRDNQAEVIRLETEINRRTENLRAYHQARTAELETARRNLMQSPSFLSQVHNEIRFIAESEGYTMVIDKSNMPGIVWYSPAVDITDRLIQRLQSTSRN